jgi:hypothetical protein
VRPQLGPRSILQRRVLGCALLHAGGLHGSALLPCGLRSNDLPAPMLPGLVQHLAAAVPRAEWPETLVLSSFLGLLSPIMPWYGRSQKPISLPRQGVASWSLLPRQSYLANPFSLSLPKFPFVSYR